MNVEEYKTKVKKERVKRLTFPSGLVIDFIIPTPKEYLSSKETELDFMAQRFPKDLTLDDLSNEDYFFFIKFTADFFAQEQKYASGLKNTPKT